MVSLKQLSYALAVAKTLHFKKAAELCHISQSALSTALTELEKQLELQIFERNNKQVLVTPLGKEVLKRAQAIMLQVEDLEHLADSQKAPLSFAMTIGVIPTIAPFLLPRIFPVLNTQYPDAQINIIEEQSLKLVDLVRSGEIDTAILALPFNCDGLLTMAFWEEDFYWVAPSDNQYAHLEQVSGKQIQPQNLMLLKEGHCLKDQVLDVCQLSEQTANQGFGATSLTTLIAMVRGNLGTTLIPAMAIDQLIERNSHLTAIHLNEPSPHRRIAFIVRPNYTRLSSIEALIGLCQQALSAL